MIARRCEANRSYTETVAVRERGRAPASALRQRA